MWQYCNLLHDHVHLMAMGQELSRLMLAAKARLLHSLAHDAVAAVPNIRVGMVRELKVKH